MALPLYVSSTKQAFASLENTAGKSMSIQYVRKPMNALTKKAYKDIPKYAKTTQKITSVDLIAHVLTNIKKMTTTKKK